MMKKYIIIDITTGQHLLGVYAKSGLAAIRVFNKHCYNPWARAWLSRA